CEEGHYCTNRGKFPCAAGRFGTSTHETSFLCSGACPAGSFCKEGSARSVLAIQLPTPCGNNTVYCPAGSSLPRVVSSGSFSFGGISAAERIAEALCPKGRYCQQGVAILCPAGTFGEMAGLQDAMCSGPCPAGIHENIFGGEVCVVHGCYRLDYWDVAVQCPPRWFCPRGAIDPFSLPCGGPEQYCPEGSGRPLPVDRGYYA
ncbi:unnamed protein product, partial [Pylaiella littoralis]